MTNTDTLTENCVHHWVLGLPQDDVVHGRCKRCGLEREYPASVEGASRQGVYDEAASLNKTVELLPDNSAVTRGLGGRRSDLEWMPGTFELTDQSGGSNLASQFDIEGLIGETYLLRFTSPLHRRRSCSRRLRRS